MRFVRIGKPNRERLVVVDDEYPDRVFVGEGWGTGSHLYFEEHGIKSARETYRAGECRVDPIPVDALRFGPCLPRPGKIVCVGLNYRSHARETGAEVPEEPILFMKASNTLSGPNDPLPLPPESRRTDWELELGVVIGASALYLNSPEDARRVIAGFCSSNDISERRSQLKRGGQWVKGKSYPQFNPTGPYLVPSDEVKDPQSLSLELSVNGEIKQSGTTADMIFGVEYLVWYVSQFMALEPGDLINTGTPAGVGLARKEFLARGDRVRGWIEGLGSQEFVCE